MKIKYFLLPTILLAILISKPLTAQEKDSSESKTDFIVSCEFLLENDTSYQFQEKMKLVMMLNDSSTYRNFYLSAYTYNKCIELSKSIDYNNISSEDLKEIQDKIDAYNKFSFEHFEKIEDHRGFRPLDQSVIGHYVNYSLNRNAQADRFRLRLAAAKAEDRLKQPIEEL